MINCQQFTAGTIVKLKSGGPEMTIKNVIIDYKTNQPNGNVNCQWFAGKKLEEGVFPIASITLVNPDTKGE